MKIEELLAHVEKLNTGGRVNKMVFTVHVKKIVAYVRKLKRDKKRMDWLTKRLQRKAQGLFEVKVFSDRWGWGFAELPCRGVCDKRIMRPTPRQAIDAAIRAERKKGAA